MALTFSSGGITGITSLEFAGTQVPSAGSNVLDDYEEGTWTPYYTAPVNPTITYTLQGGTYVKIGRIVHCSVRLYVNTVSGGSGAYLLLSGFPFVCDNSNGNSWTGTIGWNGSSWTTTHPTQFEMAGGSTNAYMHTFSGTATVDMSPSNLKAGCSIEASITYMTTA